MIGVCKNKLLRLAKRISIGKKHVNSVSILKIVKDIYKNNKKIETCESGVRKSNLWQNCVGGVQKTSFALGRARRW